MADIRKAVVVKREDLTVRHMRLWLKPDFDFKFEPGQYCTICVSDDDGQAVRGKDGKPLWRPYSIVSAPYEEDSELFIELVLPEEGGNLTPLLWQLKAGDSVLMMAKAKGVFTFEEDYQNQVMVATVTGIVPYVSIMRDYFYRGLTGHNFFVMQGASYRDEFGYEEELTSLAWQYPDIVKYVPTVSRPAEERNKSWGGETGRVNEILEKYLAQWGISPAETIIYVCGNPGMIEDVKRRLASNGWKVKEERFWK